WCWLGSLEYAPLKVSGSIPSDVNFGRLVHTEQNNYDFKWDPRKWMAGLVPSNNINNSLSNNSVNNTRYLCKTSQISFSVSVG
ncbi:hypothetical protein A2U01_0063144, partial [Trifolium medium]|nr:hypothetical protein [Trifolium medium]